MVKIAFKQKKNLMIIKLKQTSMVTKYIKKSPSCVYISIVVIDSVFKMNKDYYSKRYLEECRYKDKEIKRIRYITEDSNFF